MQLYEFDRTTNAFNFVFEHEIPPGETIYVKMPVVSANKRGINDIGWVSNAEVEKIGEDEIPKIKLEGTLAKNPKGPNALWQEIRVHDEINKCVSAIRITNTNSEKSCRIEMRAIFN